MIVMIMVMAVVIMMMKMTILLAATATLFSSSTVSLHDMFFCDGDDVFLASRAPTLSLEELASPCASAFQVVYDPPLFHFGLSKTDAVGLQEVHGQLHGEVFVLEMGLHTVQLLVRVGRKAVFLFFCICHELLRLAEKLLHGIAGLLLGARVRLLAANGNVSGELLRLVFHVMVGSSC